MKKNIFSLMQEAKRKELEPTIQAFAEANGLKIGDGEGEYTPAEVQEKINQAQEYVYSQFTGETFAGEQVIDNPGLAVKEALTSADVSIVFPRVISEVLQEPRMPNLFLQNSVADIVNLPDNNPLLVEFPTVSSVQAFEVAENQEYPNQSLSFQQHMTSIRIRKIGLSMGVSEEVINQSMWPILKLNMRLMSQAIQLKKESMLFQALTQRAQVVFDNDIDRTFPKPEVSLENSQQTTYQTTGKGLSGGTLIANGTFSYNDLVKMFGVLLGNRYNATHFLAHPLMWPVFAQDPIIRAQFYHGGQLGAGIWNTPPQFDQSHNFPFGVQYVPYYAIPYAENKALVSWTGSGFGTAKVLSDLYLIDKDNSLYMAQRGGIQMDQMDNWYRDSTTLKAKQHLGISAKDNGKGMCVARNIRVDVNQEALFTIRTVTS